MVKTNIKQAEGPLSEATFYILLCLSPSPKHGYAIMKDVRQLSQGRVSLSTGTLYGALKRLLEQDWIERLDKRIRVLILLLMVALQALALLEFVSQSQLKANQDTLAGLVHRNPKMKTDNPYTLSSPNPSVNS